jgi:FKBP-type peptidyl-prolyl cis-trans isomerase FklB
MTLTTDKDKLSYALGMSVGMGMKHDNLDVDPKVVAQGLKDVMSGAKPLMTEAEAQAALNKLRSDMMAKREAEAQRAGAANKQEGDKFLAENKTKPGVVTLPSELQYKVITEGTGPKPTANDTVVCKYRGTLVNGTEFDNSEKHGGTTTFPVSGVIKGWTEALQLMPVGSKWQLFIPPDLAYGDRGAGADIGPNSTLIFDIDLVSIQEKQAPQATQPQSKQ